MTNMAERSLNYRRGRSGRPLARIKAGVYATETHCCLCGKPVDKRRPYRDPRTGKPDPRSKSIEHLNIERDPYDVHLAHLGCNTRAGASLGGRRTAAKKRAARAQRITSSPGWGEQQAAAYGGKPMVFENPKLSHACPICGASTTRRIYCSHLCCLEANARAARDRYRARVGLTVTGEPTRRPRTREAFGF